MLLLLSITILVLVWKVLKFIEQQSGKAFKQFPSPPKIFLLGHALDFRNTSAILETTQNYIKNYGDTLDMQIGPIQHALVTVDYDLVEMIVTSNKNLRKSQNYAFLNDWLGTGLLINDGGGWKKHRKIITPAFHFEILNQFVETFEQVGNIFLDKLKKMGSVSSLDVYPLVSLCTLDIICETAMGTQINAQSNENSDYVKCVRRMSKLIVDRSASPLKLYRHTYRWTSDYITEKKCLKILHGYCRTVLKNRADIKNERNGESKQLFDENTGIKKKMAFLDLLLAYNNEQNMLSLQEIQDEINTFMFEGHDTTASAISFCLYCLASHQEVQDKAVEEQRQLFGDEKEVTATYKDLQNMKYLEMVIKETLRLYPSVPFIGRYTEEEIDFKGIKIPKNANIGMFIYGMHRNPKYFSEPETFRPERFEISEKEFPPFAYIPFSAGARNCIGQKFAMLEMKSLLSKVLRNFELLPAVPQHNLVLAAETVLKSENGIKIGIRSRIQK